MVDFDPKFISPLNKLKEKVGSGGISSEKLQKGQDFLEKNTVDFTPHANDLLARLRELMANINPVVPSHTTLEEIVKIVMQLKANGSMFHYQLLSMTSDVLLRFMEKVRIVDADFLDILNVYTNILTAILNKRLTGNGGHEGYALTQELNNACQRYNRKNDIS